MRDLFAGLYGGVGIEPVEATEKAASPYWMGAAMTTTVPHWKNQSEGTPGGHGLLIRSVEGQRLRNAILFTGTKDLAGHGKPQIATQAKLGQDSAGNVVREMSPLYNPPSGGGGSAAGYRDIFGSFAARLAYVIALRNAIRYQGQLPTDQQPLLNKPLPWTDKNRGLP